VHIDGLLCEIGMFALIVNQDTGKKKYGKNGSQGECLEVDGQFVNIIVDVISCQLKLLR